jgi:nitric oxide reductase subunit B
MPSISGLLRRATAGPDPVGGRSDRLGADPTGAARRANRTIENLSNRACAAGERTAERVRDRYAAGDSIDERVIETVLDRCEPTPTDERPEEPLLRALHCLEGGLAGYDPGAGDRDLGEALLEAAREEYDVPADPPDRSRESALDRYGLDADRLGRDVRETLQSSGVSDGRGHRGQQGDWLEPALDAARREVGDGSTGALPAATGPVLAALAAVFAGQSRDAAGSPFGGGSDHRLPTALAAVGKVLDRYREIPGGAGDSGGPTGPDDPGSSSGPDGGDSDGSRRTIIRALRALFVASLIAMGLGAVVSYRNAPPIPEAIHDADGGTIVTDEAVRAGKKVFQSAGLMNQGSILGNGAYFGVDLTADALSLKTDAMREYYARERGAESFDALGDNGQAAVAARVQRELDATSGPDAEYSPAEVHAHRQVREAYVSRYHEGDRNRGIPEGFLDSAEHARRLADFALWTAWISHADRPGSEHSYTNDWPYAPASGNRPPTRSVIWSAISVILLVGGGGIGVWAYRALDLAEPITGAVDVPPPDEISVTPAQRAAARYVPVAGLLFTAQTLVGGLLAHYHVERTGFYGIFEALGIDIVSLIPFAAGRTWHVNLAVLWISTLWLGGGLFLPGLFADRDPPFQAAGVTGLLGALVIATVGAFVGVWLGIQGRFDPLADSEYKWWWLGNEGLEYLEAGRLWRLLLLVGFAGWTGLVARGARAGSLFEGDSRSGLGHLLVYAGGSIALLFGASMFYRPETNLAITEFWRWWVVHMWVEGAFEFFMIAVVSIALVAMGLLEQSEAEQAILFEVFTIVGAGIVGVSHHYWWVGLPDLWVPIGTTFSTLEFVPIIFVLYRALGEYRSLAARGAEFPYALPFLFIVGATVWNFVGAGVPGFFLNLPVLNYYEHGTYLTLAHSHAATFGAFGLLALGLGAYILRVVTPEAAWDPTWFRRSFWLSNVGLAVMVVGSLLPVGFLQLETVYEEGFAAGRDLQFNERPLVQKFSWARLPGDGLVIAGAISFTAAAIGHLRAVERDDADSRATPA